jgi:RND family efflux transporter MFP subunit
MPIISFSLTALATLAAPPATSPVAWDAQPVRIVHIAADDTIPGTTRPQDAATLSSPFDSLLTSVLIHEGDTVRKGQIIARLDERVALASLAIAEGEARRTAAIERARAVRDQACDLLLRTELAHAADAVSDERLAEVRRDHEIAKADLQAAIESQRLAALQVELARARLEEHTIRAPFDAVVARVHASPGAIVSPGEPIAELVSLGVVLVDLYLPFSAAAHLLPGEQIALQLRRPIDAVVPATVRHVEPRLDPISGTTRVVFAIHPAFDDVPGGILVTLAPRQPTSDDLARVSGSQSETVAASPTD